MSTFTDYFLGQLLPGNYFLTKSMELSRLEDCGTLWYTKKFIVLYYYIFLGNNIATTDTVNKICKIFDSYIESMPISMQPKARDFFYSSKPTANLRSPDFKLFDTFAGTIHFNTDQEKINYYECAKKYYMAFLMESGGQSKVNKHIKEQIYKQDFCFSQIDSIIISYKKYSKDQLIRVKNDYMAFLRNERQILFYFGFFHSKSSGANDREFSSLTPVGRLAIKANYFDFIALWEHQKIKMVSQPVTCDIQKLKGLNVNSECFFINKSPYLTILNWLNHRKHLKIEEYTYLVSRSSSEIIPEHMDELVKKINDIGHVIENFTRKRDKKQSEDHLKELKKYMLGIWNLKNDKGDNPFVICDYNKSRRLKPSEFLVTDTKKLKTLVSFYSIINNYKLQKYEDILEAGEKEIRRQYKINCSRPSSYKINPKIKIDWDLYIINVDPTIMCGILFALINVATRLHFSKKNTSNYIEKCFELFPETLQFLGINKKILKEQLTKYLIAIDKSLPDVLFSTDNREKPIIKIKQYSSDASAGTLAKIEEESDKETVIIDGERKRNMSLIALLRTYNYAINKIDGDLLCECCHQPTFISQKDSLPYVEYHHLIPFNGCEGPDHFLNIYALCPMCHMKMHHMLISDKRSLYDNLTKNNYLHISIEDRLKELKNKGKITSYHLEYLLADNAITDEQYNRIIA